jgi:A/G-specific adenine glycosylase
MKSDESEKFRERLLAWYQTNKRPMPWRETCDPYHIWISEVMLQQTQVVTVIGYFNRFIKRFPDIRSLAEAPLHEVLKLWEGLGYYSRARNLHKAANQLIAQGKFEVPDNPDAFLELSGVGPYTCAAVQSIAFGLPMAVVDGNVKRVLARLYKLDTPVNDSCVHADFDTRAQSLLEIRDPSSFNQAMMELGALVCKLPLPVCDGCPVAEFCMSFSDGSVSQYPKRKKKNPVPTRQKVAGLIMADNKFLIVRRKQKGFLGGMWELPGGTLKKGADPLKMLSREIHKNTGLIVEVTEKLIDVKHAYTHFKLEMTLYICRTNQQAVTLNGFSAFQWIKQEEIDDFPFHKAIHKCFPSMKTLLGG